MTRKHFEELAKNISYIPDMYARRMAFLCVRDACIKFNDKFDANRFAKACDVEL